MRYRHPTEFESQEMKNALYVNYSNGQFLRGPNGFKDSPQGCIAHLADEMNRSGERLGGFYLKRDCSISTCETTRFDRFTSGLKVFDQAHDSSGGFMTGNVMSDVQTSMFIRSVDNVECNGFPWVPGQLRLADTKWIGECRLEGAEAARGWLKELSITHQEVILYAVFHPKSSKPGERVMHGWALTTKDGDLLRKMVVDSSRHSDEIMQRAVDVFTNNRSNEVLIYKAESGEVVHIDERLAQMLNDDAKESMGLIESTVERPRE